MLSISGIRNRLNTDAREYILQLHASNVSQSALAFESVMRRTGIPTRAYANIFVTTDRARSIIENPRVRGVTLTRSEKAGATLAEHAAHNLKKSVQELRGSDALIVLESIKLFLEAKTATMASLNADDPLDQVTALAPVSPEGAFQPLLQQIEAARSGGATAILGGNRPDRAGSQLEPTILANVRPDNSIYRQETCGPVLTFHIVPGEASATALANDVPFGLGRSAFTADLERGKHVALAIESGMAFATGPT